MRIKEEYKRSGYFWLSDGGEIELEIVGLFDESIKALNGGLAKDLVWAKAKCD
jgi:hypothetical protein